MNHSRFGPFAFDRELLSLTKHGQRIALRPKAALILDQLLQRPGETLTKDELVRVVWQGRPIQDQTLFQTMSELRRALAPGECIVTIPNVGYRFVLPEPEPVPQSRTASLVRLFASAAALIVMVLIPSAPSFISSAGTVNAAPALRAFALGMNSLDNPVQAQRYFELAARENGGFLEAQLMLSETLLTQGRYEEAGAAARALLTQAREQQVNYVQAGAMDLLSRLNESAGQQARAVEWARKAHRAALDGGHACSALLANNRLLSLDAEPAFPFSPIDLSEQTASLWENGLDLAQGEGNQTGLWAQCDELLPANPEDGDDFSYHTPQWAPAILRYPVTPVA